MHRKQGTSSYSSSPNMYYDLLLLLRNENVDNFLEVKVVLAKHLAFYFLNDLLFLHGWLKTQVTGCRLQIARYKLQVAQ